ncbi:hypothetical protein C923_02867 [Plasmodium falciparum UGT5.1]|nr:hypothetical protein PFTANZ_02828 [Plasmodium falciparum Tanzania (2000708)]ETW49277.1 hypothetical protein PFMALIP_02779 [Plasmodium falciparum MaliPS096_E11]ETW56509.1 hypothetical protein PFUGPA_01299 [Plasmodium falciparum Palo Alto/Uganda]ETW61332.1 hypothetical protein PFMC_02752 [Plasmodium falciparum CAMP/Malaysia]EWC76446.1 hypothetical protein C923_02867 [Plasmodium falciparum UGT5.1]EWC88470.1 hypothetical protein PFNF54_02789 [Plasmodium falciparum NF54]
MLGYIFSKCRFMIKRNNFSTFKMSVNNSFNIYTNNVYVSCAEFFNEVNMINKKLLYYINDYFKLNDDIYNNDKENLDEEKRNIIRTRTNRIRKKKIGCLFPPCYSQLLINFCVLTNNYDYICIPSPIKKCKQIKEKYAFYISENNIDLILSHPFYKHYIEEISFNLQIPYLIVYDKPDVLTHEQYLDHLKEGRINFGNKYLYKEKKEITMMDEKTNTHDEKYKSIDNIQNDNNNNNNNNNILLLKDIYIKELEKNNPCIHFQLSKQNECDRSIQFYLSSIYEQSKNLHKLLNFNKNDNIFFCIPTNNIQYFEVLFSVLYGGGTIMFPEIKKKEFFNYNNYMKWFTKHMKKRKSHNFSVHNIILKNDFNQNDYNFIDANSLFEEIYNAKKPITTIVCNNYLIRDFVNFFENSDINNITKNEFINKKACSIQIVLINGNEIMPGIKEEYLEKLKNIFINAKIYQRYIIQEIGTICLTNVTKLIEDNIKYERNIAGYVAPNINIEIDKDTSLLKIKSDHLFTQYYNNKNITQKSFDENGYFKTKYLATLTQDNLLKINGTINDVQKISPDYYLYFKQRKDKMEKHPPGYLKRVRLHGQIWGNFHADKRNWKRKF